MATVGQQAVYRLESSRYVQAVVSKIVSGDTVDLVAFCDGSAWGDGDGTDVVAKLYTSIALGTAVGEWQPGTIVSDAVTAGTSGLAAESYVDTACAALCNVPGASSTVSLSSGTARQPSATRPVLVMVSGSWSWNLTATGTQTGSLTLKSDSASTPTTVIRAPAWSRGIGVGVAINDTGTMPIEMDLIVPPGHYYSVTAAGGATFSIREQVL